METKPPAAGESGVPAGQAGEKKFGSPLAMKLSRILGEIGKVEKRGHNPHFNYDYITENDLVYAVRAKLALDGIFVFTSTEEQQTQIIRDDRNPADIRVSILTTVTTKHTFVDGESGEQFSVKCVGQGSDAGDKGAYKAMTGAMKYFLYKCFMIPTGDDPEADVNTDRRGDRSEGGVDTRQPIRSEQVKKAADPTATGAPAAASVPRDAGVGNDGPPLPGGKWENIVIHFGKNKGIRLGDLEEKSLNWYANEWQPKPFGHLNQISAQDQLLRKALDAYIDEQLANER